MNYLKIQVESHWFAHIGGRFLLGAGNKGRPAIKREHEENLDGFFGGERTARWLINSSGAAKDFFSYEIIGKFSLHIHLFL